MSRPLIVDTCTGIWIVENNVSKATAELLTRRAVAGEMIFVSPITAWELGLLFSCGRYRSPLSPLEFFRRLVGQPGLALAEMPTDVLIAASFLPGSNLRDPADRIIAATARAFDYTLLTSDRALLEYARQGYLGALCAAPADRGRA